MSRVMHFPCSPLPPISCLFITRHERDEKMGEERAEGKEAAGKTTASRANDQSNNFSALKTISYFSFREPFSDPYMETH